MTATPLGAGIINKWFNQKFHSSAEYWERRYVLNGNSGAGSYGEKAVYKAQFLNQFVLDHKIETVVEFGCGDGNQLRQLNFPIYTGLDVSEKAIALCKEISQSDDTRTFLHYPVNFATLPGPKIKAHLVLSLDVLYHLVEDDVFETYMNDLFNCATRYIIIYAWDVDDIKRFHVRHRKFTDHINVKFPGWYLSKQIKPESSDGFCDFFIYCKKEIA